MKRFVEGQLTLKDPKEALPGEADTHIYFPLPRLTDDCDFFSSYFDHDGLIIKFLEARNPPRVPYEFAQLLRIIFTQYADEVVQKDPKL